MESSLYISFKPIFYISMIFGTIPVKLINVPSDEHFINNSICTGVSLLYLLLILIHGFVTPYFVGGESKTSSTLDHVDVPEGNMSDYVNFIRNQTSVQMVAMRMMNPIVSFMSLGAMISSIFFVRKDLPYFFDKLNQVDKLLTTAVPYSRRQDSKITLIALIYFNVLSLPVILYYLLYSFHIVKGWQFVWNFMLCFNNFISFSSEIQFNVLAMYLLFRFRVINQFFSEYQQIQFSTSFFSVSKHILPVLVSSRPSLQRIEILHYSDKILCELIKDLNSIYKFQLLCSAAGCFIKVLFNIYFAMYGQWVSSLTNEFQLAKSMLWNVYYLSRFLVTTITASLTCKEAMKTKSLVACMNSRHLSNDIQEELNLFLNNASSTDMKFTACGLLTVNTKLITAALATGTTYLVVLVQFRPQI